jgi:hypothetical protein
MQRPSIPSDAFISINLPSSQPIFLQPVLMLTLISGFHRDVDRDLRSSGILRGVVMLSFHFPTKFSTHSPVHSTTKRMAVLEERDSKLYGSRHENL